MQTKKWEIKAAVLCLCVCVGSACLGKVIYVDADATGTNDGTSWEDAYFYLHDASMFAVGGDEIHVAQGVYTPAEPFSGDREATFSLASGIAVKGGYAGFGEPDPNARNIELYEVILSGDINGDDVDVNDPCDLLSDATRAENSYHVVTAFETDNTAILEGFTITGGNGSYGAGMYCYRSSPVAANCTFRENSADAGGGMYNFAGSSTVTNCTFIRNSAEDGGGICNTDSATMVTDCTFSENFAVGGGGGMRTSEYYSELPSTTCKSSTFIGNSAYYGGAISGGKGLISDCTITGNTAKRGGGIAGFDGLVTNCTISGNSANSGGGMHSDCDDPTLLNCILSGNSARYDGGGMFNVGDTDPSDSTLISCIISGNSAGDSGGGIYGTENSNPVLRSCTLIGNRAQQGGGMYTGYWTEPVLTNCTFSGNVALDAGGAIDYHDGLTLTNSILWGDTPDEISGGTDEIVNSDIQGGWPGEGNINADPCFADPGYWDPNGTPADANDDFWVDGDYHLIDDSLCINAADPNYTPEPNETDLDGNPRVMGGRLDMGAYESTKQAFLFELSAESVVVPEGGTAAITLSLAADPGRRVEVTITRYSGDSDITVQSEQVLIFDSSNYWEPQTIVLAAAHDPDPFGQTAEIWIEAVGFVLGVVTVTEQDDDPVIAVVFVDANAPGANNGTDWQNAFVNLQDALSYAAVVPEVEEIRAAQGVYTPDIGNNMTLGDRTSTFELVNGVALKGGYAGFDQSDPDARNTKNYETVLSGDLDGDDVELDDPLLLRTEPTRKDNCYRVVTAIEAGPNTLLEGFTIAGGRAVESYTRLTGGGIYNDNSSPTVTDCIFVANMASNAGGAMYNGDSSSPNVTDCTFQANASVSYNIYGNQSGVGGAVFNSGDCNPTFERCSFIDNAAADHAGAIYNYANSPKISNCIFTANLAVYNRGGAICNLSGSRPSFINCIFNLNSANLGGAISNTGDSRPTLMNCTFTGNTAGYAGGGVYSYRGFAELTNCLFAGNYAGDSGGAIYNDRHSPLLTNCTLAGNTALLLGGGIYNQPESEPDRISAPILTSCILWDNRDSAGISESTQIYSGVPTVNYSCLYGWTGALGGIGNIDDDPCFVDPGYWDPNGTLEDANDDFWVDGDYHLLWSSPCIDAGDPNFLDDPNEWDIDGEPRVMAGRVDIGADEVGPKQADLSRDGLINFEDYSILIQSFGSGPADANWYILSNLYEDERIDYNDLALLIEDWLWQAAWHK